MSVEFAKHRLAPRKSEIIRFMLDQFKFDLVDHESNRSEIDRVNNMAWDFMQADGLAFSDAIRLAAEIVINTDVAACEAAYADVSKIWEQFFKSPENRESA